MKRSTNTAPVSLSTSYLIGSPSIGISTMTLQSFGTSLPAGTRSRFIGSGERGRRSADYTGARDGGCIIAGTMAHRAERIERPRPRATPRPARRTASLLVRVASCGLCALACVTVAQPHMEAAPLPAPFSPNRAGAALPQGWEPVKLSDRKRPTQYALVEDAGVVVLHANAIGAASGLAQFAVFDLHSAPVVEWRWKVGSLIESADNRTAGKDDSPVRLMFAFDGDKSRLPFVDRAVFFLAAKLSGRELPYAMLQYVWAGGDTGRHGARKPVHAPRAHAGRRERSRRCGALAIAVAQPVRGFPARVPRGAGAPHGRRGADDTDNTGGSVEAWYGDIRFHPAIR